MAIREFVIGTRQQQEWKWLVIFALFFTGIGSGLFIISLVLGVVLGMVAGGVLVLVGGLFLMRDLSRPQAAWRLFSKPQNSWVTRGIIGIMGFALLALVHIVYLLIQPNGWASLGAPWIAGPAWVIVLGIVAGAAALFVATYPGFLLGNMRPISFWNGAYIPALFLVSALLGGLGIVYLLPLNLDSLPWAPPFLKYLGGGLVIIELFLLLGLIALSHPETTKESVRLFTHGWLRFHFYIGVLVVGVFLPLVIIGLVSVGVGEASLLPSLLLIDGLFHLVGVFVLRYIIFKASMYVSPVETVKVYA